MCPDVIKEEIEREREKRDGPEPDPALMVWPLSAQPDWPISDAFRDFAFDTVVLRARSPLLCVSVMTVSLPVDSPKWTSRFMFDHSVSHLLCAIHFSL